MSFFKMVLQVCYSSKVFQADGAQKTFTDLCGSHLKNVSVTFQLLLFAEE